MSGLRRTLFAGLLAALMLTGCQDAPPPTPVVTEAPVTEAPHPAVSTDDPLLSLIDPTAPDDDPLDPAEPNVDPLPTEPPGGSVLHCRDGSVSHAKHRRGACSHHGGVA